MEQLFDRWCYSTQIDDDYQNLRGLLLIEEFKSCIPDGIKTHLDKYKVYNLEHAARMTDDYSLTRKSTYFSKDYATSQRFSVPKGSSYSGTTHASRHESTKKTSQNVTNNYKLIGSSIMPSMCLLQKETSHYC